jgi:hypothetical protein
MYDIYKSSVSTGFSNQIMPILHTLRCNGSLITWTVASLTTAKFHPIIFSVSVFGLSYTANISILMILYDFCFVACTIVFYNRIHTDDWRLCTNRWLTFTLENFQCGEPCFVGAATLRGRRLLLIRRRNKGKSLLIWSVPYGRLVWYWRLNSNFSIESRL